MIDNKKAGNLLMLFVNLFDDKNIDQKNDFNNALSKFTDLEKKQLFQILICLAINLLDDTDLIDQLLDVLQEFESKNVEVKGIA